MTPSLLFSLLGLAAGIWVSWLIWRGPYRPPPPVPRKLWWEDTTNVDGRREDDDD